MLFEQYRRTIMSGGFFEYQDFRLHEMAEALRIRIALSRRQPEWMDYCPDYSSQFLDELINTYHQLQEMEIRLGCIDYVLSSDTVEEDYFQTLQGKIGDIQLDNPEDDDAWLETMKKDYEEWNEKTVDWRNPH